MAQYTPMIQQYLTIKADYEDAFLFFRLGDFYEMFFEDALQASQLLEITLTSREGGTAERIPMCGVPYHAAANYIEQLVAKGHKVAICEQVEDPKATKGVVRREVVQLLTPGTVMEGRALEEKANHFIAAVDVEQSTYTVSFADLSTGELFATNVLSTIDQVVTELYRLDVKEVVIDATFTDEEKQAIANRLALVFSIETATTTENDWAGLVHELPERPLRALNRLLHYLHRTKKRQLDHLQRATIVELNQFLTLDLFSKRHLELTETMRNNDKKGSLLWLLDETMTAMGGRKLRQWLDRPLLNQAEIEARYDATAALMRDYFARHGLRESLKDVYDLERLAGRIAFGTANARDFVQLCKSLQQVPFIIQHVASASLPQTNALQSFYDMATAVSDLLSSAFVEAPPLSVKEGGMFVDGYDAKLDELRYIQRNGKQWLAELEQAERQRTGIKSLKIGYNRNFGYFIEITKANLRDLPEGLYERRQTLTNAERFVTQELKEKEALILGAEESIIEREYELFVDIRDRVKQEMGAIQQLAALISEIDCFQCFATISEERRYVRPTLTTGDVNIVNGRHPVVERVLPADRYVPNDCRLNDTRQMLLITGPNMSGKSTYMRQLALTIIMAQIGCFVPADEATLPIFDHIFTRIGAGDDLAAGQSTFMVEMLEARQALTFATKNSLILFDEIGRGTSTYDGMALAQAMMEYIHHHIGAKTLFATHYHELTSLHETLHNLHNVHVSAIEQRGQLIFLHKVKEGPADKSYGIHVAELANLPKAVIERAAALLAEYEQGEPTVIVKEAPLVVKEPEQQLSLFSDSSPVVDELLQLNIMAMTPLEAMNKLYELQQKAR